MTKINNLEMKIELARVKSDRTTYAILSVLIFLTAFFIIYAQQDDYQQGFQDGQNNCSIPTSITCEEGTYNIKWNMEITNLYDGTKTITDNKTIIGCVKI
jgi:hypothetical protein